MFPPSAATLSLVVLLLLGSPVMLAQDSVSIPTDEPLPFRSLLGEEGSRSLRTTRLTPQDGLPSLNVNALVHAPDGLLWVATGSGCVTFDGSQFRSIGPARDRVYDVAPSEAPGVSQAVALEVDGAGHVWVAGRVGRLLRYASESSAPETIPTEQATVTCLMRDSRDDL